MSLILNELKIANSLSILGTMTTLGTAEGIRMANDAGFISFYNTANTARTGYVQGLYGTALRIGTDGSTEMQFYIGGSQQMVINTSGNVGIGVTSPTAKLQLSGSANSLIFDAHSSAFAGRYALLPGRFSVGTLNSGYPEIGYNFSPADGVYTKIANDTAWRIGFGNSNLMQFSYAAVGTGTFSWTNAMAINMSGNVGIGTTGPSTKLHVYGSDQRMSISTSTDSAAITIGHWDGTTNRIETSVRKLFITSYAGGISMGANGSEHFHISSSGNVGIGTTAPAYKLHVTDGDNSIAYFGPNASWSSYLAVGAGHSKIANGTAQAISTNGNLHLDSGTAQNTYINWYSQTNTYINPNAGNVGIGTTTPGAKLDIAYQKEFNQTTPGTSTYGLHFSGQTTANSASGITFTGGDATSTTAQAGIYVRGSGAYGTKMYFATTDDYGAGAKTRMMIDYNGNVGIGTTTPAYKLDVSGTVNATTLRYNTMDTDDRYSRLVRGTVSSVSNSGYTCGFTVVGSALASSIRFTAQGTTDNVVVNSMVDLLVNHYQDILIKSLSGIYTILTVRVVSNNDDSFAVLFTTNSANAVNLNVEVYTYNSETVTFTSTNPYSGTTLTHTCWPGVVISATGGGSGDLTTYGNSYTYGNVGIGTTSPTAKLDVNGDTKITGSLLVTGSMTIAGDLIPAADRMYSLGSSTRRWNDLYVISSSISQITESLMTISNEYTLAVVNGNRVAGFKIAINNQTSSFVIQADKFAVVNTSGVNPISPFIIENNIVYINSASIKNLTADSIAANTITADRIKANTITANEISASSITADRIRANTITANEISASAITTDKLAANSITTDKLQANSITATQISASAITTDKLAANSITTDKLTANVITSNEISSSAITTDKLAANSITATKISASAIITTHLSASIIDADKIQSNAVITTHLSASAITTAKIAADAITATQISASAITTSKIAADAIVSSHISASAITSAKIAADAITSTQISASAITSAKIAADAVTATQISASAITSAKIAADAITSTQISASAIIASKIATDAITSTHISASAITSAKIAADAVTATQISASAITTAKIAADAIVSSHISASAITSTKIAADAVTATQISASAITSAKIATDAITATHISASVITTSKIAADAITSTQISASAIIASKIATDAITSTHISASAITTNKLDANAVTAAKIAAGTITATEISASAITGDRIAANTITATQISASAITTDKLNANAVTAAKIAAGTITANEISASAITTNLIAAGAITAAKIAAGTITANEISASAITSAKIAAGAITADMITTGTMNAARIGVGTLTGITISGNTISGNTITGGSLNIGSGVFQVASSGNITSTGGTIGGWTIAATTLTGGSTTLNSNGTITCADLQASTAGKIGNWTIGATTLTGGSTTLNSNGTITCANLIASTAGTIGGWTIGASTLTGGNVTISSSGNIYAGQTAYDTGTGWYLENSGKFSVGNSGGNKLVWDGTKLKVTGGIYITDAIGIRNDGSSTLTITGGPSNASGGQLDLTPSGIVSLVATGGQFIQFYAGGAQRGYVQPSGLFDWLGTGEFDGSVTFQSGLTSNANVVVNGITLTYSSSEISAAAFNSTSSRRYKKNIVKFKSGLSIVEKLRPVTFDWKNKNVKNEIGLIAEEVNKVLPNIVHKNEKGKIESLDYSKLTPILLAAIKELTAEIKELKSRINKLETK